MPKASFATSDMGEGGGLFEGVGVISNARFGKTDYNGKAEAESTALLFTITHQDANEELTQSEQIFSVGKGWEPSEDGETPSSEGPFLVSEKEGHKLNKGCAAAMFLTTLEKERGEPLDVDKGAEDLNGLVVDFKREAAPTQQNKDRKVYICGGVLDAAPWGDAAPSDDSDSDAEEKDYTSLNKVLKVALKANKKGIRMKDLPGALDKTIKTWSNAKEKKALAAEKDTLLELADEEYVTSGQDFFEFDSDKALITAS